MCQDNNILFFITCVFAIGLTYLITGMFVVNSYWQWYFKKNYAKAKKNIKLDCFDPLLAITLGVGLLFWPIILIMLQNKKHK